MGLLKCGTGITQDCLGDTDIRYDEDASDDLADQSPLWNKLTGLFRREAYQYGTDLEPKKTSDFGPFSTWPVVAFENYTISGSRYYQHTYLTYDSFVANVSGFVVSYDSYAHSTFERDGTAGVMYLNAPDGLRNLNISTTYPVGNDTLFTSGYAFFQGQASRLVLLRTCLDNDCNQVSVTQYGYRNGIRDTALVSLETRIPSASDWTQQLEQTMEDAIVPEESRPTFPMTAACASFERTGQCATAEDFCKAGDPSCPSNKSPYQEPDGKVTPGAIAGLTIGAAVLAVLIVCGIVWYVLKRQASRYRFLFAQRVAQTMSIKKSVRSLTPDMLEKEFYKIDKDHGGRITKEALWEFLNSGKAGEINERDFEALWAVMDIEKTGTIDFLEFCSFLAHCHNEYNEAVRANRGSMSLVNSAARNSVVKSVSSKMALALAVEEEDEVKQPQEVVEVEE